MQYRCIILSSSGEKTERFITAFDEDDLHRQFNGSPSILLEYSEITARTYKIKNHLNDELILQFTESMAALFSAGMPLQDALSICKEISSKKHIISLCTELLQYITDGKRFHDALSLFSPSFSSLYIALVKLGETTNSLDTIFNKLAQYLRRNREIKQKIMQALSYPIMVCITAVLVILFIIIFVFPRIEVILEIFNTGEKAVEMRQSFQSLTNSIWYIFGTIVMIVLAVLVILRLRSHSYSVSLTVDNIVLRLPIIGTITKILCTSDFAFSMELLCSSGIPFIHALTQSQEVITNTAFRKALENSANDIASGMSITKAFTQQKMFPDYVISWIGIGERTGSVEKVFFQMHTYFENESTVLISSITSAAQPVFILIVGIIIIMLVWRFVVPIFSLIGGL